MAKNGNVVDGYVFREARGCILASLTNPPLKLNGNASTYRIDSEGVVISDKSENPHFTYVPECLLSALEVFDPEVYAKIMEKERAKPLSMRSSAVQDE